MANGTPVPGLPQTSGGNNPAVAAAQQRLGAGRITGGTDPNQIPQAGGQPAAGAGPGGGQLETVLQQALLLIAQNPTPQTAATVESFLLTVREMITQSVPSAQGPVPGGQVQGPGPIGPPR